MCGPVSSGVMFATSLALSGVQAYAQYQGQQAQVEAVEESAEADLQNKRRQLGLRLQQEERAAGQKIEKNQRRAIKARSRARVAAGEAGVTGASVEALNRDFVLQEDRFNTAIAKNLEITKRQADARAAGFAAQAQSRKNRVTPPSFLGAAARVGGDALSSYMSLADETEDGTYQLNF